MILDDLKVLGRLLREILPPTLLGRGPSLLSQLIMVRNLKLSIDGYAATCYGIIIRKAGG